MQRLHVLLITDRPAVAAFFRGLGDCWPRPVTIHHAPLGGVDALTSPEIAAAMVVVVDVAPDPALALATCRRMRESRLAFPLLGLLCCPHAVTPWQLQALLDLGATSLVDLHAPAEEVLRVLSGVARGDVVLRVRLHHEHARSLWLGDARGDQPIERDPRPMRPLTLAQTRLLPLVARGLSDAAIGARLHVSPYTVKHQIERLRDDLGVHNRAELAAWAGRQGFYRPAVEPDESVERLSPPCSVPLSE